VIVGQLRDSRFASHTLTRSHMLCAAIPEYLRKHGLNGGPLNAETAKALTDPALRQCFFLFARSSAAALAH
jgi:hypothetical protein